jgi:hypothetical protein
MTALARPRYMSELDAAAAHTAETNLNYPARGDGIGAQERQAAAQAEMDLTEKWLAQTQGADVYLQHEAEAEAG